MALAIGVRLSFSKRDNENILTKFRTNMRNPVIGLARWVVRNLFSWLLIVIILVAGEYARKEYLTLEKKKADIEAMKRGEFEILELLRNLRMEMSNRVTRLNNVTQKELGSRIDDIEKEIKERSSSSSITSVVFNSDDNGLFNFVFNKARIELLNQERAVLLDLRSLQERRFSRDLGIATQKKLHDEHVAAWNLLQANRMQYEEVKKSAAFYRDFGRRFASSEFQALNKLNDEYQLLFNKNQQKANAAKEQSDLLNRLRLEVEDFTQRVSQFKSLESGSALSDFQNQLKAKEADVDSHWITKVLNPALDKIPTALMILFGIIISPIVIKGLFYFVLAPLASRRPAVCILPKSVGAISGGDDYSPIISGNTKISAVSIPILVDESQELLVHPEYLQSSSIDGKISTKWLLDWSYPLSSLAAGMVALTRIRATQLETVIISSTKDPLSEVGVIALPEGSSLILQPHSLVGLVYRRGGSPKITKHWRLGSLHAWLTLQLRYLVFHGPVKLVLKGCRGIRVETAGSGRRINQAATMGFSANLQYKTFRCETFSAYLLGEQELLNDSFAGESGCYIYEEMPHFGKKGGLTGRGMEGVTDSMLKIFGV